MDGATEIIQSKLLLNRLQLFTLNPLLNPDPNLPDSSSQYENGVKDRTERYHDIEERDSAIEREYQGFKRTFAESNNSFECFIDDYFCAKRRRLAAGRKVAVGYQERFSPILPTRFRHLEVNSYLDDYPLENPPSDSRMPPFIVHGVSDEERYTGEDGVQRPYGMAFQDNENNVGGVFGSRSSRKIPQETGSFGKSTRRSRSRTGTPAPRKQEDPTLAAADKIFGNFFAEEAVRKAATPNRSPSRSSNSVTQNQSTNAALSPTDGNGDTSRRYQVHKEPTEVILRGYHAGQEYAAIAHYERIAGRICEDYARDAPMEERRYKGNLDPSVMRRQPLSPEEKAKALRFAGGDNWIKITFESAPAADVALDSSPQVIHGYNVFAELYRGVPPTETAPLPLNGTRRRSVSKPNTPRRPSNPGSMSRSRLASAAHNRGGISLSPPLSNSSSHTLDTATISHSSATITNLPTADAHLYCTHIPTARRIVLLPAELALLPQPSFNQRILSRIPILNWLSADVIGNQVPLTETGDFDWKNASIYWRLVYWLDGITGWFDIVPEQHEHQD